jgi:hypothetical protein
MRSCLEGLVDSWFGSAGVKSGLQLGLWPGGNGIDCVSAEEGSALACGDGVVAMEVVMVVRVQCLAH